MTDRQAAVEAAGRERYDLAVIGGGIAGAGVARDATLRGLDTLLVEQADFASGTTAYTTRLIHGGLRYLEQFDFKLVFESLQERETLAEIAPHLVDELTFLIPQYDTSWPERLRVRLGMILYDVLSYRKTMPNHEALSPEAALDLEPSLPASGLQGGFTYYDRQAEYVERLCLETILDADARGAAVLNHAEATDIRTDGDEVIGISFRDRLADERVDVDARAVLNATGPWANDIAGSADESPLVRPTKGVHLVVPQLTEHALTLPTTDGRVVFVVPWYDYSLIGTTDTDFGEDPAEARATAADVEYLLDELGRFFPDLDADDIHYTYAGVRPLLAGDPEQDASDVSRRHQVLDHAPDHAGLFSLIGAKVTPHREAAEDATDAVAEYLGVQTTCRTAEIPLPGARGRRDSHPDVPASVKTHLSGIYGSRAEAVLERMAADPDLKQPLCEHTEDVLAQVTVAVEEEHARRLTDVIFRRCTVGFEPCEGRDAVDTVADHMAALLGWAEARRAAELERYEDFLARRHSYAESPNADR